MNIQCCPHNFSEYSSVEVNSSNLRIINASGIYLPAFLLLKVKYTCTIYSFIVKISLSGVMQCAAALLNARLPQPVLVPIRTKKRFFIPPAVSVNQKSQSEQEAKARAAGMVVRQQYMERAINISCTGTHVKLLCGQLLQNRVWTHLLLL